MKRKIEGTGGGDPLESVLSRAMFDRETDGILRTAFVAADRNETEMNSVSDRLEKCAIDCVDVLSQE